MLEAHVKAYNGNLAFLEGDRVSRVEKKNGGFLVQTESGKTEEAKTVLIVSGSRRRTLNVPGEERLNGKGVIYCTTCDAPLFSGKTVAVIGGGNSGLESARDFLSYCPKVYLLQHSDRLKGDPVTEEKLRKDPRMTILLNAETTEILGDTFVTGLRYKDLATGEIRELALQGVGVEIGSVPNSEMVKNLVTLNKSGEIVIDHKTQVASERGIWAAGDVTDALYKQNNISAGDAIKAILNIDDHLHRNHRP